MEEQQRMSCVFDVCRSLVIGFGLEERVCDRVHICIDGDTEMTQMRERGNDR